MRDIISKLEELNTDQRPVQEVLSSKGKENLIRAVQNFESMAEDLNLSDQAMDVIAMHLDDMLADVMEIEGVRESKQPVKEGHMSDMAQEVEKDHEVQMARNDLYKSAKYAVAIHKMMKDISEMEGIDGWVAAKITKAADYLGSVKHYMEGQMMADVELAVVPVAGDMTDAMTVPEEDAVEEVHESIEETVTENNIMDPETKKMISEKDYVMKYIMSKHPEETKKLLQSQNLMDIYGGDLYNALFDYMSEEMPYGTQKGRDGDPVQYMQDELDSMGMFDGRQGPFDNYNLKPTDEGEDTIEEDPMADLLKNLPKNKATNPQASSEQDMISKIIAKLPRDDAEKGIDGQAKTMPDTDPVKPTTPPVPMQRKQAIANKMARDPYGADTTASFGTMKNWSKK
jgi:hypothetical protein